MDFVKRNAKRIGIDAAGYLLILLAALTGWLPGPGGIPLALAGLGLLSINNEWARRLRQYLLKHGGKFVKTIFPANKFVQALYDLIILLLLTLAGILAWKHAAIWQISIAIALFFMAIFFALMNRDRLQRIRTRRKA